MNTDKWIVEEQIIRKVPEMDEPRLEDTPDAGRTETDWKIYSEACQAYNETIASMPIYPRGDNGKWEIGQILSEDEFEVAHQFNYGYSVGIPDWGAVPPRFNRIVKKSIQICCRSKVRLE